MLHGLPFSYGLHAIAASELNAPRWQVPYQACPDIAAFALRTAAAAAAAPAPVLLDSHLQRRVSSGTSHAHRSLHPSSQLLRCSLLAEQKLQCMSQTACAPQLRDWLLQGIYAPPGETITLGRAVATANNLPYEGWLPALGVGVLIAYMVVTNIILVIAFQLMACAPLRSFDSRPW